MEASRRGIDLVLERVLASREGLAGNVPLAAEAAPVVVAAASEVGASLPVWRLKPLLLSWLCRRYRSSREFGHRLLRGRGVRM